MIDITRIDYTAFDRWDIGRVLFYPRPEWNSPVSGNGETLLIPVEEKIVVGGRFHRARQDGPTILFFHGNGEVVSDYDDVAPLYTEMGINFLPVDYRGYGRSTGHPTVTNMMRDCHVIFDYITVWLAENGYHGPLLVMGRSLGSASALELASHYEQKLAGLIIESGFAYIEPLLRLMGINMALLGLTDDNGFQNIRKIMAYKKPTLIIHAEYDHIIDFSEGRALFEASNSPDKRFLMIPGANHNDILYLGMQAYLEALRWLIGILQNKAATQAG